MGICPRNAPAAHSEKATAMSKLSRRPTLPGSILMKHYLEPNKLSVSEFARRLGLSRKHLSDIVNGHARVTPSIAVRLAHALDTSPALWVNLQVAADIFDAEREYAKRTEPARAGASA